MKYKNNPCNIRKNRIIWLGQLNSNEPFCSFDTLEHGLRAVFKIISSYHKRGYITISDIISHYAPPSENDTQAYINFICNHVNYYSIAYVDLSNKELLKSIVRYMCLFESRTVVTDSVLNSAYLLAFPNYKLPF